MYLVDTSVWVHAVRPAPAGNPRIQERLRPLILAGKAAISEWIILELMTGVRSTETKEKLMVFLSPLPRLSVGPSGWERSWDLAVVLRRRGFSPSAANCLIAAVAMEHGVSLIHVNGDFVWMAKHSRLKSTDWSSLL